MNHALRLLLLQLQVWLWHIWHVCHQIPNPVASIGSGVQCRGTTLFSIDIFTKIRRRHFAWYLAVNETCVISFQVYRLFQDSSSLVGHRGQVTGAIVYEVAATNNKNNRDRKYCKSHQREADNHPPHRVAQKFFGSLVKSRKDKYQPSSYAHRWKHYIGLGFICLVLR